MSIQLRFLDMRLVIKGEPPKERQRQRRLSKCSFQLRLCISLIDITRTLESRNAKQEPSNVGNWPPGQPNKDTAPRPLIPLAGQGTGVAPQGMEVSLPGHPCPPGPSPHAPGLPAFAPTHATRPGPLFSYPRLQILAIDALRGGHMTAGAGARLEVPRCSDASVRKSRGAGAYSVRKEIKYHREGD